MKTRSIASWNLVRLGFPIINVISNLLIETIVR